MTSKSIAEDFQNKIDESYFMSNFSLHEGSPHGLNWRARNAARQALREAVPATVKYTISSLIASAPSKEIKSWLNQALVKVPSVEPSRPLGEHDLNAPAPDDRENDAVLGEGDFDEAVTALADKYGISLTYVDQGYVDTLVELGVRPEDFPNPSEQPLWLAGVYRHRREDFIRDLLKVAEKA